MECWGCYWFMKIDEMLVLRSLTEYPRGMGTLEQGEIPGLPSVVIRFHRVLTILAQDLGYVLLHSLVAGKTRMCIEEEQKVR